MPLLAPKEDRQTLRNNFDICQNIKAIAHISIVQEPTYRVSLTTLNDFLSGDEKGVGHFCL